MDWPNFRHVERQATSLAEMIQLVAEMRPLLMTIPTGMVPQWPRVVNAVMVQAPSKRAALAGVAKATKANASKSARGRRRWSIIGTSHAQYNDRCC